MKEKQKKFRAYLDDELLNYTIYKQITRNPAAYNPLIVEHAMKIVQCCEYTVACLTEEQRLLFAAIYILHRRDILIICDDVCISFRTYRRYRDFIIDTFGEQMGFYEDAWRFKNILSLDTADIN